MSKKFTLTFAGDMSLGEWYVRKKGENELINRLEKKPFSFFEGVKPLVEKSDCLIMNIETVINDNPSIFLESKEYPNWDHPARILDSLCKLGVTAVGLANNHTMDFGPEVMLSTKRKLEAVKIATFGAGNDINEASRPFKVKLEGENSTKNVYVLAGMKAGRRYWEEYDFFANEKKPGVNSLRKNTLSKQISNLRKKDSDAIIIVYPHWQGLDYQWASENRVVQERSRAFIKAGADYVFGHGPHMLNDIEKYQNGVIAYSIGNFVFNSPGRYKKFKVPPFSLVVRLEIIENNGNWSMAPNFYPIVTDNKNTSYKAGLVNGKQARELYLILNDRANKTDKKVKCGLCKDELGFFLTVENRSVHQPSENNEAFDIITGRKNVYDVDFNDPKVVDNHIGQLAKAHKKIDANMKIYYARLTKGAVLKNKRIDNFKYYKALSNIMKKDYITHPNMRNFVSRKLSMKNAASFKNIIVQNAESRILGNPDYGRMLDDKINGYKFADKIGLRRPKTDLKIYRFSDIKPQEGPVVIKPTNATGGMGVYLIFNANRILSVKRGNYLYSWSQLLNDFRKKMNKDKKRPRKYFKNDEWIIEELILGAQGSVSPAPDIKFYVFYGELILAQEVMKEDGCRYLFWDANMNPVKTGRYENLVFKEAKGFNSQDLKKLINVSLEIPAPFMRIDMLKGKDELVLGEFTYYPGAFHMFNDEWDRKLGEAYINAEARLKNDLLKGKKFKAFCELFKI